MNNLKIKNNNGDLYGKNTNSNSKISQCEFLNFNTINERNLNYDVNKKDNFTKLRINEDNIKNKYGKTINHNLIISNHNLISNNTLLKSSGKQSMYINKDKKKIINLKDDMLYGINKFRFPTLNIKSINDNIKKPYPIEQPVFLS